MTATVLITSHDGFADCWPATLACLDKYWGDCPWPVFGMSNHKHWPNPRGTNPVSIGTAFVGDDNGWRNNLKRSIELLEFDYPGLQFVLTMLEDMLLCRPVDTAACEAALGVMQLNQQIGALRLGQWKGLFAPIKVGSAYGRILPESPYRVSTAPTLWRITYLRQILANCGDSPWDFECRGTEFARTLPLEVWTLHGDDESLRPIRCFYTAIERGQWIGEALEWLKSIGIEVDSSKRPVKWLDRKVNL